MTIRLTDRKMTDIVQQGKSILSKGCITIRDFAQLIGKLVASEPGVAYAPLYYAGLGGLVGCAVRLETRRSRVEPRRGR